MLTLLAYPPQRLLTKLSRSFLGQAKEKQKEELENAYKIEKTSATIDNSQEQSIKNQKIPYKTIAILTIGVLIIALIVWGIVWKIKKR